MVAAIEGVQRWQQWNVKLDLMEKAPIKGGSLRQLEENKEEGLE